ncbi:MAG: Fic family protein [Verrucomicrobiae bacterium]|nr:Fic family protein [Verrucomicrobiae bacterium]
MVPDNPARQWRELQDNGILGTVKDIEDYEDKTKQGIKSAEDFFLCNPVDVPSPLHYMHGHSLAFQAVSPEAGQFRDQNVTFGGCFFGAIPERVKRELEMLEVQTRTMLENAATPQDILAAMAFSHARFERIHPFPDGNGRTGRLIMEAQLNTVFGLKARPELQRDEYMNAVKQAQATGDLTELTNLFARREGVPLSQTQILAPYRIPPFVVDGKDPSLEADVARSKGFYGRFQKSQDNKPTTGMQLS